MLRTGQLVAVERVGRFQAPVLVEVSEHGGSGGHDYCNEHGFLAWWFA